jgi:hypothetical protein
VTRANVHALAPTVRWRDAGLVVAEIGPVCVVVWRAMVTRQRFEAQRVGLELVVRANPEGAGFLCLVEPTSPVPSLELQRASGNMIAIHRARLKYVACVIEGDSMRAAIVRGVLSGMRLLVTGRIAVGFWGTVGEAARGLSEALPIGAAEPFAECVETVRSLLPTSTGGLPLP